MKTVFPGEYKKKGNLRYIAVPVSVVERMNLKEGEYLDVIISRPETAEYNTISAEQNKE